MQTNSLEEKKQKRVELKQNVQKTYGLYKILVESWKTRFHNMQLLKSCNRALNGNKARIWI